MNNIIDLQKPLSIALNIPLKLVQNMLKAFVHASVITLNAGLKINLNRLGTVTYLTLLEPQAADLRNLKWQPAGFQRQQLDPTYTPSKSYTAASIYPSSPVADLMAALYPVDLEHANDFIAELIRHIIANAVLNKPSIILSLGVFSVQKTTFQRSFIDFKASKRFIENLR